MTDYPKRDAMVLDTNILIDLLEPGKYSEEEFLDFILRFNLFSELIIPEQVLIEWDNLKKSKVNKYIENINTEFKNHDKLILHIPEDNEKSIFREQLRNVHKLALRSYKYTFGLRAKHIDRTIKSFGVVLERNATIDKQVIDFSLEGKPPFFSTEKGKVSNKNESTDALIFFSMINYFKKNRDYFDRVVFITSNSKDFSELHNDSIIHSNLRDYLDSLNIQFFNNLKPALNYLQLSESEQSLYTSNISIINGKNKDKHLYLTDEYFIKCNACKEEVHINMNTIVQGHYFYFKCPTCDNLWNTGDHIHDQFN